MPDIIKFPNGGYEVTVLRKQDILNCIDDNILDKDIALAIVEHCEKVAANSISSGRWTGLPYIGNVRIPKLKQLEASDKQKELIESARETLSKEDFILFRKRLTVENIKQVKSQRYYSYIVSIAINRNKQLFRKIAKEKGEVYARIKMFCSKGIAAVDNEYENLIK